MYLLLNALILALLMPLGGSQKAETGPACRAELKGVDLLTVLELPNGVAVEGPWRVVRRSDDPARARRHVVLATLDRVIEKDALTGERQIVSFPQPVRIAFDGDTHTELVERAAEVWCVTVMRAHQNQSLDPLAPPPAPQVRITTLPQRNDAA
jgi:predicted RNase H-like HicB family nuclease